MVNSNIRIFISHSTTDEKYANAFVQLLITGLDIERKKIFCSSYSGCNIECGNDFVNYIEEKLNGTDIVFALISPYYVHSSFCIAELGASWYAKKNIIPIIMNDNVKYTHLTAIFEHIQGMKITDNNKLASIADIIKKIYSNIEFEDENWSARRTEFLEKINELNKIPLKEPVIAYSEYENKENEVKNLECKVNELKKLLQTKDIEIENLKKLKDKQEVQKYEKENQNNDIEVFYNKCTEFKKFFDNKTTLIQRLAYLYVTNSCLTTNEIRCNEWGEEIEDGLEKKFFKQYADGVTLNKNIKTEDITNIIDNMKIYLNNLPDNIVKFIEEEYSLEPDLEDIEFWDNVLNLDVSKK